MLGGMTDRNTDTVRSVARCNYSEPPPGFDVWYDDGQREDGEPDPDCVGFYFARDVLNNEVLPADGKPLRTYALAVAAAWALFRTENDPPGLQVAVWPHEKASDPPTAVTFNWLARDVGEPWKVKATPWFEGPEAEIDARRAAWKWYDDRLEFEPEEGCLLEDHDGAPVPAAPVWPSCLAWPDRTVVEVKAWTADPDAPLPEVLRWYEMTDGSAERWEPVDVG